MKTWKDAFHPSWQRIGGSFSCQKKGLTSLEGAPSHVKGRFECGRNALTSLKGAPTWVGISFDCSSNKLTSLEGAPAHIGGVFYCYENMLTSLKDIHLHIQYIGITALFQDNPIKSHVLGVLLIEGLKTIRMDNAQVEQILNKHLPSKGIESVLLAQEELIQAGLEEFAQL